MKIHIWDTTLGDDFVSLCNKKKFPSTLVLFSMVLVPWLFFFKSHICSALNNTYMHIYYLYSFYTPKFVHHDFLEERG
jgi:hypothetical protein